MPENHHPFEIFIDPKSADYDPSDESWMDQVNELYLDLQAHVGEVRKEVTPQEGGESGMAQRRYFPLRIGYFML